MEDISKRLTDLEMRISFQDATIDTLNNVITQQQAELLLLKEKVKRLSDQIYQTGYVETAPTKPPHY